MAPVQQKPIDEIDDCEQRPSCYFTFGDLNRMRTSTYYVMRSWVPGWLWAITPHFAKPWLTKPVCGDLTPEGIKQYRPRADAFKPHSVEQLYDWFTGEGE